MYDLGVQKPLQVLAILVVTVVVATAYAWLQPQMLTAGGKSPDGVEYSKAYQRFAGDASAIVAFPFCRRPGVPFLASRLPMDGTRAFLAVNLTAGAIAVFFCFLTLIELFPPRIAWFSILPMLFGIFSPIRFPNYLPYLVDAPAMAFYALAAWLYVRRLGLLAVIVLVLSSVVKESGAAFAVLFSLYLLANTGAETRRRLAIGLGIVIGAGLLLQYLLASRLCETGSVAMLILTYSYIHLRNPWGPLAFIAAASLTAGPFVFGWFYRGAPSRQVVDVGSPFCAVAGLTLIMAIFGVADMSRIIFLSYPLYVVFLAKQAARLSGTELTLLAAAGLTANRFLERIPDPSMPEGILRAKSFLNWVPEHGPISVSLALLAFWAVTYFVIARVTAFVRERSDT